MEFAPLLAAAALIWKIVDFVQYVRAKNTESIVTQLGVWLAGVAVVLLLSASDFADGIVVAEYSLASLNIASLVLLGLTIGSTASVGFDLKKAVAPSRSTLTLSDTTDNSFYDQGPTPS